MDGEDLARLEAVERKLDGVVERLGKLEGLLVVGEPVGAEVDKGNERPVKE